MLLAKPSSHKSHGALRRVSLEFRRHRKTPENSNHRPQSSQQFRRTAVGKPGVRRPPTARKLQRLKHPNNVRDADVTRELSPNGKDTKKRLEREQVDAWGGGGPTKDWSKIATSRFAVTNIKNPQPKVPCARDSPSTAPTCRSAKSALRKWRT